MADSTPSTAVLDALQERFRNSERDAITRVLKYCQQELAKHDVQKSLDGIGYDLLDSAPKEGGPMKLEQVAAVYVGLATMKKN